VPGGPGAGEFGTEASSAETALRKALDGANAELPGHSEALGRVGAKPAELILPCPS